MNEMNERIKKVRRNFDLTQQAFADRIGIKRNTIANYEVGRNTPVDSIISLICREFNVSEKWLRTGEGEMLEPDASDEIEKLTKKYHLSNGMQILIEKLVNARPEFQEALLDFMSETVEAIKTMCEAGAEPSKPAYSSIDDVSLDELLKIGDVATSQLEEASEKSIDEQVEDFRRQLIEEKKEAAEKSEASQNGA